MHYVLRLTPYALRLYVPNDFYDSISRSLELVGGIDVLEFQCFLVAFLICQDFGFMGSSYCHERYAPLLVLLVTTT